MMNIPNGAVLRPSRPRRLVFAGEAIVDIVMRVPALPPRGGDMLATSSEITAGGGFNVMSAAARHGLPVLYAGGHGTGPWGDVIRSALAAEGIAVLRPADRDRDTGFDVALVEPDAERTFVTRLGAETVRGPSGWDAVPAGPGDAVYVSGYGLVAGDSGSVLGAWAAALPFGVLLFFDPGPLAAQIPAAVLGPVLARCDWLSCNEREAAVLAGPGASVAGDPGETARRLLARAGAGGPALAGRRRGRPGPGRRRRLLSGPAFLGRRRARARPRGDRRRHDGRRGRARRGVPRGPRRRAFPGRGRRQGERRGRLRGDQARPGHRADPRGTRRLATQIVFRKFSAIADIFRSNDCP